MENISTEIKEFIKQHDYLEVIEKKLNDNENIIIRIKCNITLHEMKPDINEIKKYLQSKKFMKQSKWYDYDFSKYEPYIVSHRRKPKCLYCNVTNTILNRIPYEVENHIKGKRYQNQLKNYSYIEEKNMQNINEKELDADLFEFENSQIICSESEDENKKSEYEDDEDIIFSDRDENDIDEIEKESDIELNKIKLNRKNEDNIKNNKLNDQSNSQKKHTSMDTDDGLVDDCSKNRIERSDKKRKGR